MSFASDSSAGPEAGPRTATADFDQSFDTGPRCRFALANVRGRVRLAGWDQPTVHVRATKRPGSASDVVYHATRIEARHDGDSVMVRTVLDGVPGVTEWGHWWRDLANAVQSLEHLFHGRTPAEVAYDVQVPREAEVNITGVSCDVTVEHVRGEVRVRTVSGDCTTIQAQGQLDLQTVDGEVAARGLLGTARVQSVGGNIRLDGWLDGLRAKTVSGSVELAGPLARHGQYDFKTVSGDVTLRAPSDTGASISFRGVSGAVDGDLAATVTDDRRRPGRRRWQAEINGGGASLDFQTVSGNLHLHRLPDGATAAAPTEPERRAEAEGDRQPERSAEAPTELDILRRLERGELSVEEALRDLEAARSGPR